LLLAQTACLIGVAAPDGLPTVGRLLAEHDTIETVARAARLEGNVFAITSRKDLGPGLGRWA
jgi:hypothetical protein